MAAQFLAAVAAAALARKRLKVTHFNRQNGQRLERELSPQRLVAVSFSEGVLMAVNHDGGSDSTGSITGNLLGTMLRQGDPAEVAGAAGAARCDRRTGK